LQRRSPDSWSFEDDLAKISEDMAILGANYVGIPIFARHDSKVDAYRAGSAPSADDWLRTAELLNDKALYLARSQIRLAYHNHGLEFLTLPDGRNGYDILLERTDAKLVDFELDIGWATAAGIDCRALLDRLGSRVRLLHVKDIKPGGDFNSMQATDFGKGVVRWDEIIPAIRRHGITQIFVEQEGPYASSALDSARIAYQFLSQARETPI
jgi:sugar phosphate isomerase/epimerase